MNEIIKNLISNLKHSPGVYLMYDISDTVIYVGKAKDLFKRVSQYFLRPQTGKVEKMVSLVYRFDTIITSNEKEALVLEMNLIHKYYPRYNIMLKDNSHYPYIAIKKDDEPIISIKRNNKDKKYDYYGPYPSASSAYQTIDLLNKIFPIRKCKHIPSSTCLYFHMGQCLAPCINTIEKETYNNLRDDIKHFINGNNKKQINEIKEKMIECSDKLDFENANEYKKTLLAIEHINIKQNVETNDLKDRDIFAYAKREGYIALAVLIYRKGLLLDKKSFVIEEFGDNEEQVSELIMQYYVRHDIPSEIVVNSSAIITYLDGYLETNLVTVSKGKLHELVISAHENANNAIDEYFISARLDEDNLALLEKLGQLISIPTPYHIELFDNSHLQGSSPVGAMVAFINGVEAKKLYRKFKIEHQEARDDLLSMKEIIYRHYHRLKIEDGKLPHLILVDGGLNQINAAKEAIIEAQVDIPLFGLVKNDKHQTSRLMSDSGELFNIDDKKIFFLLTRMQDEVHRFAISYHRNKRNKAFTSSLLDGIEGLGSKRKEMIYRAYSDINQLKNATIEELSQFIPMSVAKLLYHKIHS